MRLKLHGQNIAMYFWRNGCRGEAYFTEFIREARGRSRAFNGEIFSSLSGTLLKPRRFSVPDSRLSVRRRVDTPGYARGNRQLRAGVEAVGMEKPSPIMSHVMMTGRCWLVGNMDPVFLVFCRPDDPLMLHIFKAVEDGQTRGANRFTV